MEIKLSESYEPLFELLEAANKNVDTVVITGGRNSQKSFASALFGCIGAKDYKYNILYTRYTLTSAQDSIIPDFTEKLDLLDCGKQFKITKDRITHESGAKIVFKGIKTSAGNQTASLKSLKGFNCWIYDEAEEHPDYDSWDKIQKSIRSNTQRNLSILLLNPTTKKHWIYEKFFEAKGIEEGFNGIKDNILYIHTTYLDLEREIIPDNIFNDFEIKRKAYELDADSNDGKYYKHVILGGWLDKAEGVIFNNWTTGEFVDTGYTMFGMDFGYSKDPTTIIQVAVDRKRMKIYAKEYLYQTHLSTKQLAGKVKDVCGNSLVLSDYAEPRLIDELHDEYGLNVRRCTKGLITDGIRKIQDYELIIDPASINLISELNNYVWNDKTTKDQPKDKHNHLLDAMRYAVSPLIEQDKVMGGTFAMVYYS